MRDSLRSCQNALESVPYRHKDVALAEDYRKENIFCVITAHSSLSENIPLQRKWYLSLTSWEIISLPLGFRVERGKIDSAILMEYQAYQCDWALHHTWGAGMGRGIAQRLRAQVSEFVSTWVWILVCHVSAGDCGQILILSQPQSSLLKQRWLYLSCNLSYRFVLRVKWQGGHKLFHTTPTHGKQSLNQWSSERHNY